MPVLYKNIQDKQNDRMQPCLVSSTDEVSFININTNVINLVSLQKPSAHVKSLIIMYIIQTNKKKSHTEWIVLRQRIQDFKRIFMFAETWVHSYNLHQIIKQQDVKESSENISKRNKLVLHRTILRNREVLKSYCHFKMSGSIAYFKTSLKWSAHSLQG